MFWRRRLAETLGLVASLIGVAYLWARFVDASTPEVGLVALAAAGVALVVSGTAWAMATHARADALILSAYLVTALAVTLLLFGTGGLLSPYSSLWALLGLGAALFGTRGVAPILIIGVALLILQLVGSLPTGSVLIALLVALAPAGAGLLVWPRLDSRQPTKTARVTTRTPGELKALGSDSDVLISAIGDGVLAIDAAGTIRLINPAAEAMLGWSRQDALSLNYKSVLALTDEKDQPLSNVNSPIEQTLNTNQEIRDKNLQVTTKNGKKLFVSVVASPLGEAGDGVSVVVRDITKERQEERQQAEFISTASHEMRTPVASIEGYLGLALNPATATIDEKARDYITKAHEAAQHLGRLFKDLLDISHAEDGRLSNNPEAFDIVDFIGDVVEGLQPKATDKGLQLVYKPAPNNAAEHGERRISPVYYVNLDKDHVREIVNNLTENAIKYTLQGRVVVDVTGTDDHAIISFADTGIGIPAEDVPHLFQKFYRVDNTDTREIGGTGLGLYLCRRLAETMGGRIWAESVYKQGSTFFVELPRIGSQEAQLLMQQKAAGTTGGTLAAFPFPEVTPLAGPDLTPPAVAPPPRPITVTPAPALAPVATPAPPPAPAPVSVTPPAQPAAIPPAPAPVQPPAPVVQPTPVAQVVAPSTPTPAPAPAAPPATPAPAPAPAPSTPAPQPAPTTPAPAPQAPVAPAPVATTPPAPIAPAPVAAPQPPAPTPVAPVAPGTAPANIPLSVIEQDPAAYIQSQLAAIAEQANSENSAN